MSHMCGRVLGACLVEFVKALCSVQQKLQGALSYKRQAGAGVGSGGSGRQTQYAPVACRASVRKPPSPSAGMGAQVKMAGRRR